MNQYKETKISELDNNVLLSAVKALAMAAISIRRIIASGDDGEWDYKLNKVLKPLREDLNNLASLNIEVYENGYSGKLTIEKLIQEFKDFYGVISSISPLGYEESQFIIAYEFLENRSSRELFPLIKKQYFWDHIHESIKKVSQDRYADKHYVDAVEAAFKEVIKRVKDYVNLKTNSKFDGARAIGRAFDCDRQNPLVKFNDIQSEEEKDEQRGIAFLFKGVVGIRNRKAHENITLNDPYRAMEYLALASLLMRLLDEYAK
jgi:uncharacterized protein (TIGR02391 family)